MAKISKKLNMTEIEIERMLSLESRMRIATLGKDQRINLTPMTFGFSAGKIYCFARGQKISNLRSNITATILVDVGEAWRELKGIMIHGQARVLETLADEQADANLLDAQLNIGAKSGLKDVDGNVKPHRISASGRSRRWIVFTPENYVSWNNELL